MNDEYMMDKLRRTSEYFDEKWNRHENRGYRIWPERYKWKPDSNDFNQRPTMKQKSKFQSRKHVDRKG